MSPRLHRSRRILASSVLGLSVAAGGVLAAPGQSTGAPVAPVAAPLAAAPLSVKDLPTKVAPAPTPDLIDVVFDGGTAVDKAQGLTPAVYGAPTYGTDAELGPTMASDGNDALGFPTDMVWPKLTSGFSVECVFRIDGTLPVASEANLCSNKEAGGFALYLSGSKLGFMNYVDGAYERAVTPVDIAAKRWYHAVATWDGTHVNLYVNGQLAQSTPAAGDVKAPSANSLRFTIGADSGPTGAAQWGPAATYAKAGLFGRAVTAEEVTALAAQWDTAVPTPSADVLDVDFADGSPNDKLRGLDVGTFGDPEVVADTALGRNVGEVDGDDAWNYALTPHWAEITPAVSIECTFRYTGKFPTGSELDICSGKQAGGYSIYVTGEQVGFMANVDGTYYNARAAHVPNVWHHVVGTWDGKQMKLYLDGELAATTAAAGALQLPSATARAWTVGADTKTNNTAEFFTTGRIAANRLYGKALAADEVKALDEAAFGEFPDAHVSIESSTPAEGDHLSSPVEFEVSATNAENASGWKYLLDGEEIAPGDKIGAGLKSGDHTIEITATDVFGQPVAHTVSFTSDTIPTGGGTETGQGDGKVTLSAIATSPDGSDVTTTFREARATVAEDGFQGVVKDLPTSLEFEHEGNEELTGKAMPEDEDLFTSPTSGDLPFQRFDVEVGEFVSGQQVVWKGSVDPARSVTLLVWNATAARWIELGTARGAAEGDTVLNGVIRAPQVDGGKVHLMVLGTDPFADDLAPRDESAQQTKDSFEKPEDYDFSLAHFTDTQYLAEGAAGGTYDDWDGVAEPSDVMHEEERAIWAKAYNSTTEWIAEQAGPRKIAYAGHTGDVIENDYYDPLATDVNGGLLYPGLDEQVTKEFEFTSNAQKTLDDSGLVNQVIAGNHDNQLGQETGPTSRFNKYYGPNRYYDLAANWPGGSSYHAWDETTSATGEVVERGQDNQNNYVLFSAGGLDFVAVGLSYGVTQEEADWASEIFSRFPDRNGILLTHAYIAPSSAPDGRGANFSGDGSRLYDAVVKANPNVFLILAGHEHGVGTNLKTKVGATVQHNVVELLADYQFYKISAAELWPDKVDAKNNIDLNGDGVVDHKGTDLLQFGASWLRLLQFDVDRGEVSIDTYSPMFDNFGATEYDDRKRYNGAEDNLVLPVDLSTRTTTFSTDGLTLVTPTDVEIGSDTAKSGWPASVEWTGLVEGEIHAWTAESRSVTGEQIGAIRQFGTVFVASADGTDTTPPTLTMSAEVETTLGEEFNPLEGVTATDDVDGDVTESITVIGAVDVDKVGSYALTYVVSDKNANQTIAPRVVTFVGVVQTPKPPTVRASDVKVRFGRAAVLRARVQPWQASGTVRFMNGEEVLCEAWVLLGNATCVVRTLPPPGDYNLVVHYTGNKRYQPSSKTVKLTVEDSPKPGRPNKPGKPGRP